MKELLLTHYNIYAKEPVSVNGREGFRDDDYYYFTISSDNREMIQLEQAALAYYLSENGYKHTALPIPTVDSSWFVDKENNRYLVTRVGDIQNSSRASHGITLAQFHEKSAAYQYEPQEISSYGQWKELWTKKLMAFEHKINQEATSHPTDYYRLLMDVLPYIIGISENAIQYIHESETDKRYHQVDQGVFAFRRYKEHLIEPVIWSDDLVYDHPARDLAEYLRYKFLEEDEQVMKEVVTFMIDYQTVRPLSILSWRILYARLAFPIHFFDYIEDCFEGENFERYQNGLRSLMKKQVVYENRLHRFYDLLHVDYKQFDIPVLHWL